MFDDSYFFFNEEEDVFPLPEEISVKTALEVVKIVVTRTSIKLNSIQSDLEGGVLILFSSEVQIQISSRGSIFPSRGNTACKKYFTLEEFDSFVELILKDL